MPPVTTEQVGIFLASLEVGELVSEPELHEEDGFSWYEADAEMMFRRPMRVQIAPICEGWEIPYKKGDRVRVLHNHGIGVVLMMYSSAEGHDGHTHIAGRAGKDLRLGSGSGEWEALMLAPRAGAELRLLDFLLTELASVVPGGAAALETARSSALANPDIGITSAVGGDAASGAKGRKA